MTEKQRRMTLQTAARIVRETPGGVAGVSGAFFAYHATPAEGGHHFSDHYLDPDYRHRPCLWCGRTRWQVRHEDIVPACSGPPDTARIVTDEEARFFAVVERAPSVIAKHIGTGTRPTPEQVAFLHDTHGIPPDLTLDLCPVP